MSNESEARANPETPRQPRICRAIAGHQASYPDPISMEAGEIVDISEKVDEWNGNPNWVWIWCTDQRGKSGWVPKTWIDLNADGKTGTARYDYAATELTVAVGDELVVEGEGSGWLWCTNRQGKSGWVPADNVVES
ncbi:MAG TPA: SH3 domain-containing protein [Ktedonobacteraceae bacterium]